MKPLFATLFVLGSSIGLSAQNIVYPTDDGMVYYDGVTIDSAYVAISPGQNEGDIHFAWWNASVDSSIELEVNPYAEPLFGSQVYLYGFNSTSAQLSGSDYNSGTFLGTWNVAGLNYGQETFFNVTSFVQSIQGPYIGFELQSDGVDVFSSSAYGTPPELIVTESVPEPSFVALAGLGAAVLLLRRHRK